MPTQFREGQLAKNIYTGTTVIVRMVLPLGKLHVIYSDGSGGTFSVDPNDFTPLDGELAADELEKIIRCNEEEILDLIEKLFARQKNQLYLRHHYRKEGQG